MSVLKETKQLVRQQLRTLPYHYGCRPPLSNYCLRMATSTKSLHSQCASVFSTALSHSLLLPERKIDQRLTMLQPLSNAPNKSTFKSTR